MTTVATLTDTVLSVVTILFVSTVSGDRYNGWNHGRRGGGGYSPAATPYRNQNHNQNFFNNNFQNNLGGFYDRVQEQEESGCPLPVFTDQALFEVEGCEGHARNRNRFMCLSYALRVPAGKKGVMSCQRGRRLLRLTSICTTEGSWDPAFEVRNCEELFEVEFKSQNGDKSSSAEDSSSRSNQNENTGLIPSPGRSCRRFKTITTSNGFLGCEIPDQAQEVENCFKFLESVQSGTKVGIRCRPPYANLSPEPSELSCQDGRWVGKVRNVVCTYVAPTTPRPNAYPIATTSVAPRKQKPPGADYAWPYPTNGQQILPSTTTTTTPKPKPLVTCPALSRRSDGVELSCVVGGAQISTNGCDAPQLVGTEARYNCLAYHESVLGIPTVFRKCRADGTWSGTSDFVCIVQCGRENIVKTAYITNSLPTIRAQWPWHAGIFLQREPETWDYICGGSLITKKSIITAAHCVTIFQTTEVKDKSNFRVHLGKYRREDNDELVQIKEVEEIMVNPSYNPYSYDSDLAIIVFKSPVNIGYHVRPICFPQTSDTALEELQLSEGTEGTVVGWGMNEKGKLAEELRMTHLRVVGSRECAKSMVGSSFTQINTRSTTFCAGYLNGTISNVCNGDSGGGMFFPTKDSDNTKWYLQGLVSVGVSDGSGKCDPSKFSVFTRIGRYADFITRTLSENDAL